MHDDRASYKRQINIRYERESVVPGTLLIVAKGRTTCLLDAWTCLDDPASLRPLDRDSTATNYSRISELVPGALTSGLTGTTTRVLI